MDNKNFSLQIYKHLLGFLKLTKRWLVWCLLSAVLIPTQALASALLLNTPSPDNIDLSQFLDNHGGIIVVSVGNNGNYLVSSVPNSQLFEGYIYNSLGRAIGSVDQSTCGVNISQFFNGGLARVYVRMTLDDGDSAEGNFDEDDNFLQIGSDGTFDSAGEQNFSDVLTEDVPGDGRGSLTQLGYPNAENVTGWFAFPNINPSIANTFVATGSIDLYLRKDDRDTQYYDFSQGAVSQIQCTAGSTKSPAIVLRKNVIGDDSTFDFDVGSSSQALDGVSDLQITTINGQGFVADTLLTNLNQGQTYSITELINERYQFNRLTCSVMSGNANDVTITYTDGPMGMKSRANITFNDVEELVECVFENEASPMAYLTIIVDIISNDGRNAPLSEFGVSNSAALLHFDSGTAIPGGNRYQANPISVLPGVINLFELDVPGYNQGDWSCSINGGTYTTSGPYNHGVVEVAGNDVVVCKIINDDLPLVKTSNLSLVKSFTPGGGVYVPGGTGEYLLTVHNNGPDDVVGATISDTLVSGISLNTAWICDPAIAPGTGVASCVSGQPAGTSLSDSGPINLSVDIPNQGYLVVRIPVKFEADMADY